MSEQPQNTRRAAVVLFSHGSLLCGSQRLLDAHAQRLQSTGRFLAVEPGYLNYSHPPVEDAVGRCVHAGATLVLVVPYFLVAGKFVTQDLPPRLDRCRTLYPQLKIRMAQALQDNPLMMNSIQEAARQPVDLNTWERRSISAARSQCENRPNCPLYGSALCRSSAIA